MRKVVISNVVLVIAFALVGYWYYSMSAGIGPESAKTRAEKFINDNLMQPGMEVKVQGVTEVSDLYRLDLSVGEEKFVSYMSKDGTTFFNDGMVIEEVEKQIQQQKEDEAEQAKPVTKSDKPEVELFVMSLCPYGTQIEKGMLPVLDTLGDKIDFKLRFVDYAMHDKEEIDENLNQYCIQKEQPEKLKQYMACYLKDGKSADCVKSTGVNAAKLTSCVAATDKQFKVTEKYNDKGLWESQYAPFDVEKDLNSKYGVGGSPTLVINGSEVDARKRDSAGLLATVCSAFNTAPEECQKELSSETPAPGFGEGKSASSAPAAECGN